MPSWKSAVGRVRLTGMMEGVSFLLLLGVAMPLKYLAHIPEAVKWTGWCHGLLFVLYCFAIFSALVNGSLSFKKSVLAFVAALIPFGPFLVDRKLAVDDELSEPGR
jgi:integral membrane protein